MRGIHWGPDGSNWNFLVGGMSKLGMKAAGGKSNHDLFSTTKIPFIPPLSLVLLRNLVGFRVRLEGKDTKSALLQPYGKESSILPFIYMSLFISFFGN